MISVSTLALGLALCASPYATRSEAADVVAAGGPDAEAAKNWLHDAGRPGLWALSAIAQSAPTNAKKANVLEAIGWWRTEEAEYVLRRALKEGNTTIKVGALRGMGHLATSRIGRVLADEIGSPNEAVRDAAIAALIEIGPSVANRVWPKLDDANRQARRSAVIYFAKHANDVELDEILARTLDDREWMVVEAAIDATAARRRRKHLPRLTAFVERAPEAVAIRAGLAYLDAASPAQNGTIARLLEDRRVRAPVRAALKKKLRMDASERSYEILALAAIDAGPQGAASYRDMMVSSAGPQEAKALFALLASRRPRLSAFAQETLGLMGDSMVDGAFEALPDASVITRKSIVEILVNAPRSRVMPKVLAMAKSDDDDRQIAAIRVMEAMADNALTPRLVELANDARPAVRLAAIGALGPIPSASARVALEKHLADPSSEVQVAALRALAAAPTKERNDVVLGALDDERPNVRLEAIHLLSPASTSPVLDRFERMLENASASERIALIQGIAKSKLPGADMLLLELVTHRKHEVRKAAVAAVDGDWE